MVRRSVIFPAAGLLLLAFGANAQEVQTFALTGTQDLVESKSKLEAVEYKGRKAVRMLKDAEGVALTIVRGTQFQDGTIEADVALKVTTPPGVRNPGFIGIGFRSQTDAMHYDLFYIRPANSHAEDQAMRNHSVQYVAAPGFDWYRLRRNWPWVYESYADLQPEAWTHVKIEVEGRRARLYVNGSANPALVVDGLKGSELKGAVGLWGSPGQESYFSNLRISHGKPQPVENGGEATGTWEVSYSTDAGNYSCVMKLQREGGKVVGTSSGVLGTDLPVTGSWSKGYLELAFRGVWPGKESGEAAANLAGWIDGNSAKGRLSIPGRADGLWTAIRKE